MAASKPKKEVFEKTRGAFGKKGSLRRAFGLSGNEFQVFLQVVG